MAAILYSMEAHGIFSTLLYEHAHCASIVEYVKGLDAWEIAKVLVETGDGKVQITTAPETRLAHTMSTVHVAHFYKDFEEKVGTILQPLISKIWELDLPGCTGTQLVRYPAGGHFTPHTDVAECDPVTRYFTVLCYLNDNFEGGKTVFPSLRFYATPVAGKALVFPARYFHCAEPVTKGEKFVIVTWLCGPLPVHWI